MLMICGCGDKQMAPMFGSMEAKFALRHSRSHVSMTITLRCTCGDEIEVGPGAPGGPLEQFQRTEDWKSVHRLHEGD